MISHHVDKLANRSGSHLEDTPGKANVRGLLGDLHGSQRDLWSFFLIGPHTPGPPGLFRGQGKRNLQSLNPISKP